MYYIEKRKTKRSKKYTQVEVLPTIDDVIHYMNKNKVTPTGIPYLFTHIDLSDGSIITCRVSGLLCSPTELRVKLWDLCLIEKH